MNTSLKRVINAQAHIEAGYIRCWATRAAQVMSKCNDYVGLYTKFLSIQIGTGIDVVLVAVILMIMVIMVIIWSSYGPHRHHMVLI